MAQWAQVPSEQMNAPYSPVHSDVDFPQQELAILKLWDERRVFQRSISQRDGGDAYVFYDGPPFATGLPHFGHFVPGTIKDVVPRYQAMRGKRVERRFGWDCHGLPVEYEVEKLLNISGKSEIERYGVAAFNEKCRSIVLRYTAEWRQVVNRMGRWVDFDNDYKTMQPEYMESIWWIFKQLWDKKLIYRGYYILPYSAGLATPVSNFEVNLGGYREVDDPAVTVKFVVGPNAVSQRLGLSGGCALLAWTTTPWTLPSNLGLAVGGNIDYAVVQDADGEWIVACSRLAHYWKQSDDYTVKKQVTGAELVGLSYRPLFSYFEEARGDGAFEVLEGGFVTTEDGTGIVHLAPAFGEDDYNVFKGRGVTVELPIDDECKFTARMPEYQGLFVKDADKHIIRDLKQRGLVVRSERYRHSYPFCYRTNTPLIYRAVSSWFVNIERIKQRMIDNNQQVRWTPHHMRDGRFGKWLEQARDWAISRNRYWGNPIPIWQNEDGSQVQCVGSRAELERLCGRPVDDLHKHFVDELSWEAPNGGGLMRRVPEVLDCWFESGAMPYAQQHYPFDNKQEFEHNFPADFICEGVDQTRGWFYTLSVLSSALFDKPPSRSIVVNGLVLDANGNKMSKSKRNYSDPKDIIDRYGADALRLFLMRSNVTNGEDLKYSDDGVIESLRKIIIPLWNAYGFFVTYANIDGVKIEGEVQIVDNPFDQWICSECQRLVREVESALEAQQLSQSTVPIIEFIELLNNWYIRRSRRRFWSSSMNDDKRSAYAALYTALMTVITVAAPLIPFITEVMYQNLRDDAMADSVHLCDFPTYRAERRIEQLEEQMRLVVDAVQLGRTLRKTHSIKNRQPLSALYLISSDEEVRTVLSEFSDIIKEELNVKEVVVESNEEHYVEYGATLNYKLLGKKLGGTAKEVGNYVKSMSSSEVSALIGGASLNIEIDGATVELTKESVVVQRIPKGDYGILTDGAISAIINATITPELAREGVARDVIRFIQRSRKEAGLEITDHIDVTVGGTAELQSIVNEFATMIKQETLCDALATRDADVIVSAESASSSVHRYAEKIDGAQCVVLFKVS